MSLGRRYGFWTEFRIVADRCVEGMGEDNDSNTEFYIPVAVDGDARNDLAESGMLQGALALAERALYLTCYLGTWTHFASLKQGQHHVTKGRKMDIRGSVRAPERPAAEPWNPRGASTKLSKVRREDLDGLSKNEC